MRRRVPQRSFCQPSEPVVAFKCQGDPDILLENEELSKRLLRAFVKVYPEFSLILDDENLIARFYTIVDKVKYFFTKYECMSDAHIHKGCEYMFYLLLAHFAFLEGMAPTPEDAAAVAGLAGAGDLVSSASVGDVSISFDTSTQAAPYSQSAFKQYLAKTKWGREYLALLDYTVGVHLVN